MLASFAIALPAVLFIVDPIGVVPIFVALTGHETKERCAAIARRATVVAGPQSATVFISGTAAIRGHATIAPHRTRRQLDCALENLAALSAACGLGPGLAAGSGAASGVTALPGRVVRACRGMASRIADTARATVRPSTSIVARTSAGAARWGSPGCHDIASQSRWVISSSATLTTASRSLPASVGSVRT